jgi:hypothetical protein
MSNEVRLALKKDRLRTSSEPSVEQVQAVEDRELPGEQWRWTEGETGAIREAGSIQVEKVGNHHCVAVFQVSLGR